MKLVLALLFVSSLTVTQSQPAQVPQAVTDILKVTSGAIEPDTVVPAPGNVEIGFIVTHLLALATMAA